MHRLEWRTWQVCLRRYVMDSMAGVELDWRNMRDARECAVGSGHTEALAFTGLLKREVW